MIIEITSDADLPKCLNTTLKQAKKARQLAQSHSGIPTKKAQDPHLQEFFSRTMIVTLQNGEDLVIQFRPEHLDLVPFEVARSVLGPVVPESKLLQDEELEGEVIWSYWMKCVPGKIWLEGVRPHLALLLSSEDDRIRRFHEVASNLLGKLDRLKTLPHFVSHFDLNGINIMVEDDCEVLGIVDWELSTPLPFGMGFSRLSTFAGEFSEKKFRMPPEFEDTDRGFWQEVYEGIPADVRKLFDANPDAIQIAVTLGTLLDAFQLDEGKIGPYNPVVIEALPKLLTYRIPFIRGLDPPYSE